MANTADDRRKKLHRTGALGLVLAQAEAKATEPVKPPGSAYTEVHETATRTPHRFYPTKGFGRVPAKVCRPWKFADRPDDEFGHMKSLAKSIEANGQVQPALVRVCSDPASPDIRYEVIAGVARWRSAMSVNGELDVQIRELTDAQAYRAMVAENEDRQNLSDYARAKRFATALETGLVASKTELAEIARLSASQMSYLLGFASLPGDVLKAVSDIKSMPVRLGYVLSVAVRDGFKSELIRDMALVENGEIPRDLIPDIWREARQPIVQSRPKPQATGIERRPTDTQIFKGKAGNVLCRMRTASNGSMTLKMPPSVSSQLSDDKLAKIIAVLESDEGGKG